jgi:hypothetical protein
LKINSVPDNPRSDGVFYQRDAIFIDIERKQVEIASLLVVYHVG